jgi:probable HAF family extracellular repeat protein
MYEITNIGGNFGAVAGYGGLAINDKGEVAGGALAQGGSGLSGAIAFVWHAHRGMRHLPIPTGFVSASAQAINDAGQIAGAVYASDFSDHAVRWNPDGTVDQLGALPGMPNSQAADINEHGHICGMSYNPTSFVSHAYLWTSQHGMRDLGTLAPDLLSSATSLNNHDQVVGFSDSQVYDSIDRAFDTRRRRRRHHHGRAIHTHSGAPQIFDLGAVAKVPIPGALGINDAGHVVGAWTRGQPQVDPNGFQTNGTAYRWEARTGVLDLGILPNYDESFATVINRAGHILGGCTTNYFVANPPVTAPNDHPFIWIDGVMSDLNTLIPANSGWELQVADDMNDRGQIVGLGTYRGTVSAFVLTPR